MKKDVQQAGDRVYGKSTFVGSGTVIDDQYMDQKNDDDVNGVSQGQLVIAEYNLRLVSLVMIKQLMHLCRDVQKHRGLSMGLLAGNQEFAPRFRLLQKQMARRIDTLHAFSKKSHNPLTIFDVNKINEAWETIRAGWHDDSVLENFQFHSHFVEQLLQLVMKLSGCLRTVPSPHDVHPLSTQGLLAQAGASGSEPDMDADGLLTFVCQQLPKMIEFLGMVRALATHSASLGHSVEEHDKKLKYYCQCVHTEKVQIIAIAEQLHQKVGANIPTLLVLRTYEFKVDALIDKVGRDIIGKSKIKVPSDDLFTMITDIMDVYWRVVDDGIDVLHHQQDQALESWYIAG